MNSIKSTNRIDALDSLRGLACLLIVIYHIKKIYNLDTTYPLDFVISRFALGVPLFFVLSAFSIFYALDAKSFTKEEVQNYFIRRFFRIAPLYYFMLLIYFFYNGKSLFSINYLSELFLNLTFMFGFSPQKHEGLVAAGWSIGIEFIIYIILPILFCVIRNLKYSIIAFIIVSISSVILAYEYNTVDYIKQSYSYKNMIIMLPFFFLGIMIYKLHKENCLQKIFTNRLILIFGSVVGILLIYACYYYQLKHDNRLDEIIKNTKFYVYISSFLFFFIILLQLKKPIFALHNSFFKKLGVWSYSIYLVHPLVILINKSLYVKIYGLFDNNISFLISSVYTLTLILIISYFTYTFIEKPGINYGKKIIVKIKSKVSDKYEI